MTKIKELLLGVFQNFIYDVGKSLFLSVGSASVSIPLIYKFLKDFNMPKWSIITLTIGLVSLVVFGTLVIYQKFSYRYITSVKSDCNYTVLDKKVKFKYEGKIAYYQADITIEFNKKSREYYGKYYWSGSGKGYIDVTDPNYKLNTLKQRTRHIEYMIVFDRAYKKGEKISFTLKGTMEDDTGDFSPYFSTTVSVPTKKLVIVLDIDPKDYPIINLKQEISQPHQRHHENSKDIVLDTTGQYIWDIQKPKINNTYCLTWDFKC